MDRRRFLSAAIGAAILPQQGAAPEADRLWNPEAAGRSRIPIGDLDNSEEVKAIERRLKCTCGCNLDIYTCRTTDFTCEYSPALHREVMDLTRQGKTSEEVIAAFVEKYGEQTLMAPPARGFNLAGYLVPGVAVLTAGTALAVVLLRRARMVAAVEPAAAPMAPASLTAEEQDRLARALSEVAD